MKDLTLQTMIAVFEEMFGNVMLWVLISGAAIVTAAYLFVLFRDRAVSWRKFLLAQLAMPFGAVAAVMLVLAVTHSSLGDLGGPIDWIVMLGVAALGAIGAAILVYTIESFVGSRRTGEDVRAMR